jgi:hypothetical protein
VIRDNTGGSHRGEVPLVTGSALRIRSCGFFLCRNESTFDQGMVTQVDIVDSETNGWLLGAAAGIPVGVALASTCDGSECLAVGMVALPVALVGGVVGALIDRHINHPAYTAPQPSRVRLSPVFGRRLIGVAANVQY